MKDVRMLRLCGGEQLVDRMDNVEDTKGNNGDRGESSFFPSRSPSFF